MIQLIKINNTPNMGNFMTAYKESIKVTHPALSYLI